MSLQLDNVTRPGAGHSTHAGTDCDGRSGAELVTADRALVWSCYSCGADAPAAPMRVVVDARGVAMPPVDALNILPAYARSLATDPAAVAWAVGTACVLGERAANDGARATLRRVLTRWATPLQLRAAHQSEIRGEVNGLGLGAVRTAQLVAMADRALEHPGTPTMWPGPRSEYAHDAILMFACATLPPNEPRDPYLRLAWRWAARRAGVAAELPAEAGPDDPLNATEIAAARTLLMGAIQSSGAKRQRLAGLAVAMLGGSLE